MKNNSSLQGWSANLAIQLQLFQSTKQLNLSETYEAIPKDVSPQDPGIRWISEHIAESVEKPYSINGKVFIAEISPANFKNTKTKIYQSHFPHLREARIEYVIISMASKKMLDVQADSENNKIFYLRTTYYQIQKEIVQSINKMEGRNLKPNDCPYNTSSIKEALEILKRTDISVRNESGESVYIFNRIKDIYMEDKKVVIELWNMISQYISSGEWRAADTDSILASKSYYTIKLRTIFNVKFRYAGRESSFSPSLSYLIEKMAFHENKEKRITLQKVVKIVESMHEVEKVVVDKMYNGKKITDAILHIYPSPTFIETMIENNKLSRRAKEPLLIDDNTALIEPIPWEFETEREYQKARQDYYVLKGKALYGKLKK